VLVVEQLVVVVNWVERSSLLLKLA